MGDPVSLQDEATSTQHSIKAGSPVLRRVSLKSSGSMEKPIVSFQHEALSDPSVKPSSPVSSCVSMKSDASKVSFQRDDPGDPRSIQQETLALSEFSYMSLKSGHSMDPPLRLTDDLVPPGQRSNQQETSVLSEFSCMSLKSHHSMDPPLRLAGDLAPPRQRHRNVQKNTCRSVQQKRSFPSKLSCVSLKSDHSMDPPLKLADKSVPPTLRLTNPKSNTTVQESVQDRGPGSEISKSLLEDASYLKFKTSLKERFQRLSDGIQNQRHSTLLNEIYTELYITEGDSGEVNNEHEVRQIEIASRAQLTEDKPIKCNDIFNPLPGQDKLIRTVLTKGVAGIGKTVSVQKFILDWAEDKTNQNFHFIFPLPFRELNLLSKQHFSLESLIHHFFVPLKDIKFADISNYKIVFIFDGLDERRSPLDFRNGVTVSDVTEKTSVDILLTSLLKGCLLPSALIWVTSRPAAASQIPSEHISQVTEIRGFNDPQKEEYFTKKISDQILAKSVISHLKSSRSLYIMCHIPVFCWISATVLERMLTEAKDGTIPKTLTQMYTHFLIIQTCIRKEKYGETKLVDKEMIFKLGQLAFQQLIKGNLIFYENDLRKCNINVRDAVVYSGVCTQIFREEFELSHGKGKVFCFVHLSIQEHLAALYVHLSFCDGNKTVLNSWNPKKLAVKFECSSLSDLHKCAVDKALQCKSGQFDLFLRFLLGISQEKNQSVLSVLLPHMPACSGQSVEETIEYIKIRLRMNLSPEKYINLFHCLNELNDFSLEEEIQTFQSAGRLSKTKLSSSQWAALVFVLLTSDRELNVFDLRKYSLNNADECLQKMLPVVMASRTAEVRNCDLSEKGFHALTKAFSSKSSNLRELKLNGNKLHGSGMKILSEGFKSSHCKVEILELSDCGVDAKDTNILASSLNLNHSFLRELDISFNYLHDVGIKQLSSILWSPYCRLEKLKLLGCELTWRSCSDLAAALMNNSSLTELDLSKNALQDSGVHLLSYGLNNPHSKLRCLSLEDCGLTSSGCKSLVTALIISTIDLRELCLNRNRTGNMGTNFISDFLKEPCCKMEKLKMSYCNILEEGCIALASAIQKNPSHLRELELIGNKPGDNGRQVLYKMQQNKDFRLEKLKL